MSSLYSQDLRIELIQNGEQSGTWGNTTNNNLGTLIEDAISGVTVYTTTTASYTLTALNGVADQARSAVLSLNTSYAGNYTVIVPTVTKIYVVKNNSSSRTLTIKTSAGTGVGIPPLKAVLVRCNTSGDMEEQFNHVVGNFSLGGTLTVDGNTTLSNPVTIPTSAFLGGSQTATISVASPSVITVASAPDSGTAVVFTTSDTLPTGLTVGTVYYVSNINSTTFNVSTSSTLSPLVNVTVAGSGTHTVANISLAVTPPTASNSTQIATTEYVTTAVADSLVNYQTKEAVKAATTQNITLSGAQTIDGISIVAGDRVLVKDQFASSQTATITIAAPGVVTVGSSLTAGTKVEFTTTGALPTGLTAGQTYYVLTTGTSFSLSLISGGAPITTSGTQSGTHTLGVVPAATNGVYIANASTWTRATDMNTAAEVAAASVPVLSGTSNGGKTFNTSFKSTNTLGTTTMAWDVVVTGDVLTNKTLGTGTLVGTTLITSGTSIAATSGTAIDFTSIPSWVKRVTVMFSGVAISVGTHAIVLQLGTGATPTYVTTGYSGSSGRYSNATATDTATLTSLLGFAINLAGPVLTNTIQGTYVLTNITGNTWVCSANFATNGGTLITTAGTLSLGAALSAVRITTNLASPTTTFTAGNINILYE